MKIVSAEYLTSAVSKKQYPRESLPELAFAGRSNVGKSSLLNSLLNRKKLVKTSSTPGKTQMINFFQVNEDLMFVDLPGYGFAKVPADVRKKWQAMIEEYILGRNTLVAVVFLIDIRRNPTELDIGLLHWLKAEGIDYILVATKADKLNASEKKKQIRRIREGFLEDDQEPLWVYSSKSNMGRNELWREILRKVEATKKNEPGKG